jgi:hypothetical protein
LKRGCELGFEAACGNLNTLTTGAGKFERMPPTLTDYPIILRGSKGEIREREPTQLLALACSEGWPGTCTR